MNIEAQRSITAKNSPRVIVSDGTDVEDHLQSCLQEDGVTPLARHEAMVLDLRGRRVAVDPVPSGVLPTPYHVTSKVEFYGFTEARRTERPSGRSDVLDKRVEQHRQEQRQCLR